MSPDRGAEYTPVIAPECNDLAENDVHCRPARVHLRAGRRLQL